MPAMAEVNHEYVGALHALSQACLSEVNSALVGKPPSAAVLKAMQTVVDVRMDIGLEEDLAGL